MFQHSHSFTKTSHFQPPQTVAPARMARRSPTLSRTELRRLIADMID
ncbi:MAG: hypothetical protein HEQ22_05295 [Sphingopyxis sp.]